MGFEPMPALTGDVLWHRGCVDSGQGFLEIPDSGTLTYKNVNLRHQHKRHFLLTFLQAF